MTTTPNMGLTLPTDHGDSDRWDVILDAVFGLIDAHDHSPGKGVLVPTAGLKIAADKSWSFGGTPYAITDLKAVDFFPVAASAVTALAGALFVNSADNNLYFRTTSGSNVKLTNGAALNVAAFAGGIGGDYTAVAAALNYDDSGTRYTFKGASGTNWARLASGEVRILETGTSETLYVGLAAPAALAGSYTMTWPVALPGSQLLAQIDNAGLWSFSNTVAGLITASAGLTASANQHVTVSGTGLFKHGTKTLSIHGVMFMGENGNALSSSTQGALLQNLAGREIVIHGSIMLPVGSRISAIRAFVKDSATGPTKLQASFSSLTSTGTQTTIASSAVSSGAGTNQTLTISPSATTMVASTVYEIVISVTTGGALVNAYGCEVDYDQP